jgi:small-conductance mechanosensitive channel
MRKVLLLLFCLLLLPSVVAAQTSPSSSPTATSAEYAPVTVDGQTLFEVMGAEGLNASDRAARINRRLAALISRAGPVPAFTPQDARDDGHMTTINVGGEAVAHVTDADAQDALTTREALAATWGTKMASAVMASRQARAHPMAGARQLVVSSFHDLLRNCLMWLPRLAAAIVVVLIFWLLTRLVRLVTHLVLRRTHFDANLQELIHALAYYGTWVIGAIAILSTLGLQGTSIATTLGISGFVLGFAFKDILSHFFAGLMLLIGRHFHIGDQIQVDKFEGTVERIELRALYLRTYDNRLVVIPNGNVFTNTVTSNTSSTHRRRSFIVAIGFDQDLDKAMQVALDTVKAVPGVLAEPEPDVLVHDMSTNNVELKIRVHMRSQRSHYIKVGSECMRAVKKAFDEAGIQMSGGSQALSFTNPPIVLAAPQVASEQPAPVQPAPPSVQPLRHDVDV